ncbi:MAG: hypothetical protein HeimC3_09750 [Candidatus Heimdallarchaeota archaeon LC_3]|nr:MAG: hypothetical protein HeimC3_09750 [Candidatus Heimdallarchaeota archaeon LC_3]
MSKQSGFLFIADVTGYTKFVASKELEHSNMILTNVLKSLVDNIKPVFSIVKLEGDAVFGYLSVSSETEKNLDFSIVKIIYSKFKNLTADMSKDSPCGCEACSGINALDLKFFIHYGDFIIQNISGIVDLFGNDVNLLHRLTKNSLFDKTGWKGYLMMTEPVKSLLKIESNLYELEEPYDDLGLIKTYNLQISSLS